MRSPKLRVSGMKERVIPSEVSWCLKSVMVLMCRVSAEVSL